MAPTHMERARARTPQHQATRATHANRFRLHTFVLNLAMMLLAFTAPPALAQVSSPVYLDTSTRAVETLARLDAMLAAGNTTEAARALQALLDEDPYKVVPKLRSAVESDQNSTPESTISVSVRSRVHTVLRARPALLARYRELFSASADRIISERGDDPEALSELTRRYAMTSAGAEALLRLTQWRMERADFDGAWWTLQELADHPDRVPAGRVPSERVAAGMVSDEIARDAARLASELARYIPGRVATLARRWMLESGIDAPASEQLEPSRRSVPALDAFSSNDPIRYNELVPQPVGSVALLAGADESWSTLNLPGSGTTQIPPWVMPVVTEDRLFINDGVLVGAWDRFTLRPIWRSTLAGQNQGNNRVRVVRRSSAQRIIEDIATVAVDRDLVVVPAGLAVGGSRRGDTRIHAFGSRFGESRWAVELGSLHPDLRLASVRGQPMIVGDRVVLATRTTDDARRLVVVRLIALDRASGQLLWMRTLGSAGAQYQAPSIYSDLIRVHHGVAYLSDEIGVINATRIDNGEPVWVREHAGVDGFRTQGDPPAWGNRPVPIQGINDQNETTIYTVSPDRTRVLAINASTGELSASREADALGSARYLLHSEDTLVGIGTSTLSAIDLVDFDTPGIRARTTPRRNSGSFESRAVVAGDDVVVPSSEGLLVFDPRGPMDEPVRTLQLDTTGTVVLARGQVITVDRLGAHAYLVWGEASAMLERRILDTPNDPAPAIALAELAVRANRPEAILRAIELGERASELADDPRAAREMIFESVAAMVEPVLEPTSTSLTFDNTPAGIPVDAGSRELITTPGGLAMIEALLRVMDRTADLPEQVVRHRLARGSLAQLRARPGDAIAAYQEVLSDPALASSDWVGIQLTVRAGLVATRRVRDLMRTHGMQVYDAFETEADVLSRGWALANDEPAASRAALFESAASSYPGSRRTPKLWLDAGNAHEDNGDLLSAMTAWRSGLASVLFRREITRGSIPAHAPATPNAAIERNPETSREDTQRTAVATALASQLARALGERGQLALAASLLAPLSEGPGATASLILTLPEGPTPLSSFLDLARRVADERRFPSIGTPAGSTQLLSRWTMLSIPSTANEPTDAVLLHSVPERSLALFGPGLDGRLAPRWRIEHDGVPTIVRMDRAWTELLWVTSPVDTHPRAVLQRVETATGRVAWTTEQLHTILEPVALSQGVRPGRARVRTPLDGTVPTDQLIVVGDGGVVFVVDRVGSAMALDAQTGALLWSRRLDEISQIHRATAFDGRMLVGGMNTDVAPGQRAEAVLLSIDTRSGRAVQQFTLGTGDIRWITPGMNSGEGGIVLVGIDEGIAALNLNAGRAEWISTEDAAMGSIEAWTLGDRVFVLDETGSMHLLEAETGTVRRRGLRTDGRLRTDSGVTAWTVGDQRLVLGSTLGLIMYDRDGLVRGVDAIDEPVGLDRRQRVGALLTPKRIRDGFITFESRTIMRTMDDGYRLHLIDDRSLRREHVAPVRLLALPDRIGVIDDHILITASGATLVIPAPGEGAAKPSASPAGNSGGAGSAGSAGSAEPAGR